MNKGRNKMLRFERGLDPKKSLGIGKDAVIKWLKGMDIKKFKINDDLSIDIPCAVDLSGKIEDSSLPTYIKFNKVKGCFNISDNSLITLKNCPKHVKGTFDCSNNKIETYKDGPKTVVGNYITSGNPTDSLDGIPKPIVGTHIH